MYHRVEHEHVEDVSFLGAQATGDADTRASQWFSHAALHSGAMAFSFKLVKSHQEGSGSQLGKGISKVWAPIKRWLTSRLHVMWAMLYQFLVRVSVSLLWWPFFLIAMIPFTVDAVVTRRIMSLNFGLASPHAFVVGRHVVFMAPFLYVLLMLVPLALPAVVLPVTCLVFAWAVWTAIVHFAKRA